MTQRDPRLQLSLNREVVYAEVCSDLDQARFQHHSTLVLFSTHRSRFAARNASASGRAARQAAEATLAFS
ncbi:hypothetical protein [Methylobacterium fujisawaense]|jgi:hypothetical protein